MAAAARAVSSRPQLTPLMGAIPILALLLLFPAPAATDTEAALWQALKTGGHAALIRHADAPGFDDPPGFRIGECATQRNLSEEGRERARAIGARFRANGIPNAAVYSSQWCRCLETARLLGLGEVKPFPGLNSFFRDTARRGRQTAEAKALIRRLRGGPPPVLVTHQVNIAALAGVSTGSGEIVIVRLDGDDLSVIGRIR